VRELHETVRKHCTDEKEYKRCMDGIRSSVLTAFYTPPVFVRAIADTIYRTGDISAERMLDPSAGTGVFAEAFSGEGRAAETVCFEKDPLTGAILGKLFPGYEVHTDSFHRVNSDYNGSFDLVASNIPFGTMQVFDAAFERSADKVRRLSQQAIHNYFFIKGVDMLREGGILAFITSQGVLDSPGNAPIREWLIHRCNLISALRLPNNLFTDYAGTQAGSDLIVLQKNSGREALRTSWEEEFMQTADNGDGIVQNRLIAAHPHLILHTTARRDVDLYGKPAMVYTFEGSVGQMAERLSDLLASDMKRFDRTLYLTHRHEAKAAATVSAVRSPSEEQSAERSPELGMPPERSGSLFGNTVGATSPAPAAGGMFDLFGQGNLFAQPAQEELSPEEHRHRHEEFLARQQQALEPRPYTGKVQPFYRNGTLVEQEGQYGHLKDISRRQPMFHPLRLNTMQRFRAEAYLPLRDTYHQLYRLEARNETEYRGLRRKLGRLYDNFVRTVGDLNGKENAKLILQDATGREILLLERFENGKKRLADIFACPVSFAANDVQHVDTALEALTASLNRYGRVDLPYMSRLSDIAPDELVVQLEGRIYYNPMAKTYEIADRFIAGNVIEKAEWIANYLTEHPDDEASRRSLDALKEHTPTPLTFDELDINLGVRWLDTSIYADFARELFGLEKKPQVIYIEKLDEFDITTNERNAAISEEYCVKGQDRKYDGLSLFIYALHNTLPDITKCIGYDENNKPVRVKDAEAVQLADAVVNRIRQAFSDWLQERPEAFRQQLTDRYNRLFNCIVRPRYDGSFQSFPGLDLKGLGIDSLYGSQKDAI
jgi:hypothetical protein